MVKEFNWTSLSTILDRCMRHPLMQELTIDEVAQYAYDFISIVGTPKLFEHREDEVIIEDYRGVIPCDTIAIEQVKDCRTDICLRSMTGTFNPTGEDFDYSFKTSGRIIFTSFKDGKVLIAYKAIPVDEDGLPMIPDNANFLKALELYIKREIFTIKFDMGEIQSGVLQNVQQQYSWYVGQCISEFTIPSQSEMETIKNIVTAWMPRHSFSRGWKDLAYKEHIKIQ